jgi:hypothetical protein
MAILLPQQFFTIGPNIGKSYYENLNGGVNASVTVQNNGPAPIELVITRVNAPVISYVIPSLSSLTLSVSRLLVAALLTGAVGTFGTIQIATSDF